MYEIRRYLSCAFVRTQAGVTSRVKGRFETRACTYVCTIYTPSSYISNEIKLTGTMREIILSLYIYMYIYMCKCYVSAFQIEALRDARKNFVISIYFAHHWHPPSPGKFTYVLTWILSPLNSAAGSACLRGRNRKERWNSGRRLGRVCTPPSDGGRQRRRRVCIGWINWLGGCKLEIWTFVKRIPDGGGIRFGELWRENLIEGIVGRFGIWVHFCEKNNRIEL